jgi:hypothetical protein
VWVLPLVLGCVVVLITAFYVGSVVDPLAHLSGLPVAVVNQDRGAVVIAARILEALLIPCPAQRHNLNSPRSEGTLQATTKPGQIFPTQATMPEPAITSAPS